MVMGNGAVSRMRAYAPIPIEASAPTVEVLDPSPYGARHAVQRLAVAAGMAPSATVALMGAVSEVVTNADDHGRGPVVLRAWVDPSEIVVTITDAGPGPDDPEVGGQPAVRPPGLGGLGLWLAHQLCDDLVFGLDPQGFTVRMRSAR